jgi:hypothetical protein
MAAIEARPHFAVEGFPAFEALKEKACPLPASPMTSPELDQHGFALVPDVLDAETRQMMLSCLGPVSGAGRRGLLALPFVDGLARSKKLLDLVRPHGQSEPFPVRATYFDKSPEMNWLVPWHQDLTLALGRRIEVAGFTQWSTKGGIPHAQPPVELLEKMLTVRLHLDQTDNSNGALRVLPGSHRFGRLSAARIQDLRGQKTEFVCLAKAGDALLMRPLLLHASSRTSSNRHRRVLHLEYAAFELPGGLSWNQSA